MDTFTRMDDCQKIYSKTEIQIYEKIKKFPKSFANDSQGSLAATFGFTKPALTRFAQKVGFSGFQEFQFSLRQDLDGRKSGADQSAAAFYDDLFARTEQMVSKMDLEALDQKIHDASALFLTGAHITSLPARQQQLAMQVNGIWKAQFCATDRLPVLFDGQWVLMLYSVQSGNAFLPYIKGIHARKLKQSWTVLVTTNPRHPLRHYFDQVLLLPPTSSDNVNSLYAENYEFSYFNQLFLDQYLEKYPPSKGYEASDSDKDSDSSLENVQQENAAE